MLAVRESRVESRVVCQGAVRLFAAGVEVPGRMLDVSERGFRASHECPDFAPGMEIRFQHQFFVGMARVVWTREVGAEVQSGFQILR